MKLCTVMIKRVRATCIGWHLQNSFEYENGENFRIYAQKYSSHVHLNVTLRGNICINPKRHSMFSFPLPFSGTNILPSKATILLCSHDVPSYLNANANIPWSALLLLNLRLTESPDATVRVHCLCMDR